MNPIDIKKKYTTGTPGKVLDAEYIYYDTAPDYAKKLAIVCSGYEKCMPDYEINRGNYPYYFIKYTIKGHGTLEINNQTYKLCPGTLTGFEPGTPHHYKANPNNPMEHIFITFVGSNASELLKKSSLLPRHFIEVVDQDETLNIFNKILQIGTAKTEYAQEISCHYLNIILLEQAAAFSGEKTNISASMGTYRLCKSYIDAKFSTIKSPAEVAEHRMIDVRYMSSLFKRYSHIPPGQYLMRLKLNKAANMLLTSGYSIKEIAFQVGFDDQYHFSKNFKKFHGSSPSKYRANHV